MRKADVMRFCGFVLSAKAQNRKLAADAGNLFAEKLTRIESGYSNLTRSVYELDRRVELLENFADAILDYFKDAIDAEEE